MYEIKMKFINKENQVLYVKYDSARFDHPTWDENGFLGRIKMKELLKGGFKCIERKIL